MDSDTIDEVTEWDSTSVGRGYRGLHELADASFSGAITDGVVWAFMLNGSVVGVFDGTIEEFEDADLSAYRAPDDALPLLFAMREQGGETRAQYYTNDTPLSEADQTLTSGGFTGYVELSENVLSGDYYVVYYGGKSMSVAFIGNSRKLLTGEEAFERADGEVGIYQVRDVDVEVVDLPAVDAAESDPSVAAGGVETGGADDVETGEADEDAESQQTAATGADQPSSEDDAESEPVAFEGIDDATESGNEEVAGWDDGETGGEANPEGASAAAESTGGDDGSSNADDGDLAAIEDDDRIEDDVSTTEDGPGGQADDADVAVAAGDDPSDVTGAEEDDGKAAASPAEAAETGDVFAEEAEWRDAQAIPALSPDENDPDVAGGETGDAPTTDAEDAGEPSRRPSETEEGSTDVGGVDERLAAVERERDEYRERLEALQSERDEYREEVERLEARIDELEAELERLRSRSDGEEALTPAAAREGTNLFVRYRSKSNPTLASAHDGEATREAVVENLRIEYHTRFEADEVSVDGETFEEFLFDSVEYGFVRWVAEDLLFEIAETGNRNTLGGLFDAIPEIDRAELAGTVSVEYTEDGETHREQQRFDVVLRNRMGNPLLVANVSDSRAAASEEKLESLIGDAKLAGESNESLVAACHVTSSYFEPGALELAAEETGGGLFSRSKRKSFVKLSRKRGFHLCLVETREGDFHMSVPDL